MQYENKKAVTSTDIVEAIQRDKEQIQYLRQRLCEWGVPEAVRCPEGFQVWEAVEEYKRNKRNA